MIRFINKFLSSIKTFFKKTRWAQFEQLVAESEPRQDDDR